MMFWHWTCEFTMRLLAPSKPPKVTRCPCGEPVRGEGLSLCQSCWEEEHRKFCGSGRVVRWGGRE